MPEQLFDPITRTFAQSVIDELDAEIRQDSEFSSDYEYLSDILLQSDPELPDGSLYIEFDASIHKTQLWLDGAAT